MTNGPDLTPLATALGWILLTTLMVVVCGLGAVAIDRLIRAIA